MDEVRPRLIGRYEIQRRIGAGGMGVLWLARDPMLDRPVAIKLMRDGGESAADQERFLREARSAGRLHHPNIVTIFDVGQHDGELFIAMQYIVGETLASVVNRRAQMPVARKLRWMEDLCSGLHYAHGAGIIHRDIKPANVMVDESDAIKILDFGIARLDTGSLTQGGLVGTLNYISPEQMAGGPVDRRADIFALGAVLYELFAYQRAFPGGIADGVLTRILDGEPEPLDRIVPDIDPEIVAIVGRCLAKKQADRYADCLSLAQALATVRLRHDQGALSVDADATVVTPSVETPGTPDLVRIRAEEVRTHLARARAAMAGGAFDEAVRECERAVVLDPDDSEALTVADQARAAFEQQQVELNTNRATTEVQALPQPPQRSTRSRWAAAGSVMAVALTVAAAWWLVNESWRRALPNDDPRQRSDESQPPTGPQYVMTSNPPLAAPPAAGSAPRSTEKTPSPPPAGPPTRHISRDPASSDAGPGRAAGRSAPASPVSAQGEKTPVPAPASTPDLRLGGSSAGVLTGTGVALPTPTPTPSPPPSPTPVASKEPTEADKAAALRKADESAIRGVLMEYAAAYERLDATAVTKLRSLTPEQGRQIADQFKRFRSQSLRLENITLTLADSTATVRTRVVQRIVPLAGQSITTSSELLFEFQKNGNSWTIAKVSEPR